MKRRVRVHWPKVKDMAIVGFLVLLTVVLVVLADLGAGRCL